MCRKIPSHWQPLFSKIMAAAASFSYKIGGGGLIFLQNWRRRPHFHTKLVAAARIWQHYWRLFWHGLDIGCGVLQTADSKELFIILPQTSHRFQSKEVPFLKLIFLYLNIKLSHSVNGSNVWGSFGTFWWCTPLVQMEYLTTKGNWHNWRQSANHPGKKIIAKCHLEFSYSYQYYSPIQGAS